MRAWSWCGVAFSVASAACGGATPAPRAATRAKPPVVIEVERQIITKDFAISESALRRKAELALMAHQWQDAADDYDLLITSDVDGPHVEPYWMGLALAYEGLEQRDKASDAYRQVANRFPKSPDARTALIRASTLTAYLENWKALGEIADTLLARADIDDVDRVMGLGSRGLARIESGGDVAPAYKDVLDGLDLTKHFHFGGANVLPVAFAQLKFAEGEVRRVQADQIKFQNVTIDQFSQVFDDRGRAVLSAQAAYADAVRSTDPHWALMASDRVGEMYRAFHRDLMEIPPVAQAKSEYDKQVFYAFMHVRFRVILEKGMKQIEATLALGKRLHDTSLWMKRALEAKQEMEATLAEEKAELAKYPFTEETMTAVIQKMANEATHH